MSRVGKVAVPLEKGTEVKSVGQSKYSVKGAKGEIKFDLPDGVTLTLESGRVVVLRESDDATLRSLHGTIRANLANAVHGVTRGFTKSLELQGVGYRASVSGKKLEMSLGFSHPIEFAIPEGIEIKVEKQTMISVIGASKELVGQVAAQIRGFRPPEPYLGKGVRYVGEKIRKKAGKSAGK